MKTVKNISPLILCLLYMLYPICKTRGFLFGYHFFLISAPVYSILLTGITFGITLLVILFKSEVTKVHTVFSALLPIFACINGLFLILTAQWKPVILFFFVWFGCSMVILFRFAQPAVLKTVSAVISVLMSLCCIFLFVFTALFENFVSEEVMQTLHSPENTYDMQVIVVDQGALGGNTFVEVQKNSPNISLLFGSFSVRPVCIYTGRWGEAATLQISWQDEQTLLINEKIYHINELV